MEEAVEKYGHEFAETLIAMRNGAVVDEMGKRLRGVVSAVRETGKAGSLTLTFKVTPTHGSGEVVSVEAEVKEKTPQPTLGKSIFFTMEDGKLNRRDPRQMQLTGIALE